jgi:prepilin-type N-terminal cleavage/methylation domain-containing protein
MRHPLDDERGYSLVEMLVVMLILGVVMAGLTTIFVSGSHAELDLNRRFQAQQNARLALDKIRADIHCAASAQAQQINTYYGLAISAPNCSSATIDWCVVPSTQMSGRYTLFRTTGTSNKCQSTDTSRVRIADYLTQTATANTWFQTPSAPAGSLEFVSVDFPVSVNPQANSDVYELKDSIVARNSTRCGSGTCTFTASP